MPENYPQTAQGPAVPANNIDISHDRGGITYPNLHRRIDNEIPPTDEEKEKGLVAPEKYTVLVSGVDSYRNVEHTIHSEEDDPENPSEVP